MAELISVEEANAIGRIPVSGRTSDENAKYDAFIINQLNPSREQQPTNPYSSNPANASEYRNYIDWRVNQGLQVGSSSSGEQQAATMGIGNIGNYQSTKDAAKASENNILAKAYTGIDREGNLIGGVVGASQEVVAKFVGSAPNGGNPYADAAEKFVAGRPGFTPLDNLGDPQTQMQLQRAQAGLELSSGAKESLVAGILGNQMRAAQERGAYREVQYYGNEIQKTAQNAVERASEYHHIGMGAGVPTPANPFEYKGDLAVEFLKGTPQYEKDVFSPVSGHMSSTLPLGGLGLQEYQWELAKVGQQGATREYYNVNFNPAISALGEAEGKYGPYGFLYGGPNYTGTPSSSGNRMQTPPPPGSVSVGGLTNFDDIVKPEKPVEYVKAPDGTMQPDYMMGGKSTRLVGGNKVAAMSTQTSQDYTSTLPSQFVPGTVIKPSGDIGIPFTDIKIRIPGVSDALAFFTPAIYVSGKASSVTKVNPAKSGGVDYANVFINPETNKATRELTREIGEPRVSEGFNPVTGKMETVSTQMYETVTLPETKTVFGFTGVQQKSAYDTLLDEQYRSRIPDPKTGEKAFEVFDPQFVSREIVFGVAERLGIDTAQIRKEGEYHTALFSPTKGMYTLAYERPELVVVEYGSGAIFGATTRGVSAIASKSATLSRAAPVVEKYGGTIFTALYGGSVAYEETEGFTKFEPENVAAVKSHLVVGFPSMTAGFRAGYTIPESVSAVRTSYAVGMAQPYVRGRYMGEDAVLGFNKKIISKTTQEEISSLDPKKYWGGEKYFEKDLAAWERVHSGKAPTAKTESMPQLGATGGRDQFANVRPERPMSMEEIGSILKRPSPGDPGLAPKQIRFNGYGNGLNLEYPKGYNPFAEALKLKEPQIPKPTEPIKKMTTMKDIEKRIQEKRGTDFVEVKGSNGLIQKVAVKTKQETKMIEQKQKSEPIQEQKLKVQQEQRTAPLSLRDLSRMSDLFRAQKPAALKLYKEAMKTSPLTKAREQLQESQRGASQKLSEKQKQEQEQRRDSLMMPSTKTLQLTSLSQVFLQTPSTVSMTRSDTRQEKISKPSQLTKPWEESIPKITTIETPRLPPPLGFPNIGVGMGGDGRQGGGGGPSTRKRNYKNPVVDIEYLSSLPGLFGSFGRAKKKRR